MKKQTIIIIILVVLVASVIALSAAGIIGPQEGEPGSFAAYNKGVPTVSPENTMPSSGDDWDNSEPTTP